MLPGLIPMAAVALLLACAGQGNRVAAVKPHNLSDSFLKIPAVSETFLSDTGNIPQFLEEITEFERAGMYQRGMGFLESEMKERVGDYTGAVAAAFKEMARLYGFGEIKFSDITNGLERAAALDANDCREGAVQTALALIAFSNECWDDAEKMLTGIFTDIEEPDDFVNWMLLSCAIEKNPDNRRAVSVYRSIRARYAQFPEYWYRGARLFSGAVASDYAEKCINIAPNGPFASPCRNILASLSGLKAEDGAALRSKFEIENYIIQAVNSGNPGLLEPLIPLISLPENPFTLYALGALKALAGVPVFLEYFDTLASNSKGRLADRLVYICRG